MTDVFRRVEVLRDAGRVKRLHTVDTHSDHTIERHVYGSQVLAVELCILNGLPLGSVLWTLLIHDAPELETGDVPAPTKRASPAIDEALASMEEAFYDSHGITPPRLSAIEESVVKACDTLDLAFAALYERRRGNRHPRIKLVFRNCMAYLQDQIEVKGVEEFTKYLEQEFKYADLF